MTRTGRAYMSGFLIDPTRGFSLTGDAMKKPWYLLKRYESSAMYCGYHIRTHEDGKIAGVRYVMDGILSQFGVRETKTVLDVVIADNLEELCEKIARHIGAR